MLKRYKSRKHLQKILITVTLLLVGILVIASGTIYYSSEQKVYNIQRDANNRLLEQMNYNITYMDEMIKNLSVSLFFDMDMVPLMYRSSEEYFDINRGLLKITTAVQSTSFLHSIVVYNRTIDGFLSNNTLKNSEQVYKAMGEVMTRKNGMEKMKPIPVSLDSANRNQVSMFTYPMYESLAGYVDKESVIFFNVKPEWIFDNLNLINNAGGDNGNVLIMDTDGRWIAPDKFKLDLEELSAKLHGFLRADASTGSFKVEVGGENYLVTYQTSDANGWTIFSVHSSDNAADIIAELRLIFILSTLIFIVVAVVLSVFVSHRLYSPIERLVRQFRKDETEDDEGDHEDSEGDELSFLSQKYVSTQEKMYRLMDEKDTEKNAVRKYVLRSFVSESNKHSEEEFRQMHHEYKLQMAEEGTFRMVVIRFDDYAAFAHSRTLWEQKLLHFAVQNIALEIYADDYCCEAVDIKPDHHVILLSRKGDGHDELPALIAKSEQLQQVISSFYQVSLTISISEEAGHYQDITDKYEKALQNTRYRIVFGQRSVMTPETVQSNEQNNDMKLPPELEKRYIEEIKRGDRESIAEQLEKLLQFIRNLRYDHIRHALLNIIMITGQTIREMNENRLQPIVFDFDAFHEEIMRLETLEQINNEFSRLFDSIANGSKSTDIDGKAAIIVQAVKEIVQLEFRDPDLSLQKVSSKLKLSTSHVGRVFKQAEMISVAEYLNEVRLQHVLVLLENHMYSVSEIMDRVGYVNESNFYKLFKKKYGTTPKEYRLKKSMLH